MNRRTERMSRGELIDSMRRAEENEVELRRALMELQIYREELSQQNEQLLTAQQQLEASRNRYAELYDSAPVGYVTLDGQGVIEEINLTGARMLGQEVHRLVGRPFLVVVCQADVLLGHLTRCRNGGEDVVSEIELRRRDGEAVPVEMRSRVVWRSGRSLFQTTLHDLTERRRAEAERRELALREQLAREANEAKDRFLAILSHELRNPLAAISAAASVLSEEAELPPPLDAVLERVRRNVVAEARLVDDLLDASRLRHAKLRIERRPVDLHLVVEDAAAALRNTLPALELALDAEHHVVLGDAMRLGQVLSNLLRNAREATSRGGRVRVISANPSPERVVVAVEDTGCGMEREALQRLFRPFEQSGEGGRKAGGLGLGLAIARGLVDAHGGEIRASSRGPGRGARFEIELEVHAQREASGEAHARSDAGEQALRILLVDDHRDTAESLATLLEMRGFAVVVADSVASALQRADDGFDVLVSDVGLPDGTGCDLARRLATRGPLRAIALSGYGAEADVSASRDAGFGAHLVKPVEPAQLIRVIRRVAAA